MLFSFFCGRLGLLHLCNCVREGLTLERAMCLNFVEERNWRCDGEIRGWWWRQVKSIYR